MDKIKEKRKEQICRASMKYRTKNIEHVRNLERIYKINFREFQRLRCIDLF
jgi:hypothetical protein